MPAERGGWFVRALGVGLLLILALRLTLSESPRESFSDLLSAAPGVVDPVGPGGGPATTVALGALTLLLVGVVAWTQARRRDLLVLGVAGAILACAGIATYHAADHFGATVGTIDLAMALVGGWGLGVLARDRMCRRLLLATLLAILAAWVFKGAYQYFIEFPDTRAFYAENKARIWAEHGWQEGDPAITLFESRMRSNLISSFLAFSNVCAAGLGALVLLGVGIGLATWSDWRKAAPAAVVPARKAATAAPRNWPGSAEISLTPLLLVLLTLLLICALVVLLGTHSRGGFVASVAMLTLFVLLWCGRAWTARRRRRLVIAGLVAAFALTTAVLAYGVAYHRLPEKSLRFRWHYWIASAQMVRDHRLWGVGLNNFGDYYMLYKLPESPEAVKDPHNFFVRYAAEMGLPAAGLALGLVGFLMLRPLLRRRTISVAAGADAGRASGPGPIPAGVAGVLLGVGFATVWFLIRAALVEPPAVYLWALNVFYAIAAAGGFWLAWMCLANLQDEDHAGRLCALAALAGAAAMLFYDQVNMGLVTGPVAMLFWTLLFMGHSASDASGGSKDEGVSRRWGRGVGGVLMAAGLAIALGGWWPVVTGADWGLGRFDERPLIRAAAAAARDGNAGGQGTEALRLVDAALERDPRSEGLRRWRIALRRAQGLPVAQDIDALLALNRTDVRLWLEMGTLASDWPAASRRAALKRARWLNEQLEPTEIMRLNPEEQARLDRALQALADNPAGNQ